MPDHGLDTKEKLERLRTLARLCDVHDVDARAWASDGPALLLSVAGDLDRLLAVLDLVRELGSAVGESVDALDEAGTAALDHAKEMRDLARRADREWRESEGFAALGALSSAIEDRVEEADTIETRIDAAARAAGAAEAEIEAIVQDWP